MNVDYKLIGKYQLKNFLDALDALSKCTFLSGTRVDKRGVGFLLEEVRKEVTSRKIHMYFTM
jgi:hypothetical protein